MVNKENGAHEWVIEFRTLPKILNSFVGVFDMQLKNHSILITSKTN